MYPTMPYALFKSLNGSMGVRVCPICGNSYENRDDVLAIDEDGICTNCLMLRDKFHEYAAQQKTV